MSKLKNLSAQARMFEAEKKRRWKVFIGGIVVGGVVSGLLTSLYWGQYIISNF